MCGGGGEHALVRERAAAHHGVGLEGVAVLQRMVQQRLTLPLGHGHRVLVQRWLRRLEHTQLLNVEVRNPDGAREPLLLRLLQPRPSAFVLVRFGSGAPWPNDPQGQWISVMSVNAVLSSALLAFTAATAAAAPPSHIASVGSILERMNTSERATLSAARPREMLAWSW